MLFNLERDDGDLVLFYLVPDTHSEVPAARVAVDDYRTVIEFEANELRDAIRMAGRHETGLCGFRLDASILPGLAGFEDLEIRERDSNILIYRRRPRDAVARKILRIETRFLPMFSFERSVEPYFQYYSRQIENYGLESSTQMFQFSDIDSVYLAGRINYVNFAYYAEEFFERVMLVDDPFVILAERLLVLGKLHESGRLNALSDRDAVLLGPAAAFAAQLPIADGKAIRRALRNVPREVAVALANPVTRLLTTKTPDEMPRPGALASALDTIASFAIVGIDDDEVGFRDTFAHLIERDPETIAMTGVPAGVARFAQLLREEAQAESLIATDLELHAVVTSAHRRAVSRSEDTEGSSPDAVGSAADGTGR